MKLTRLLHIIALTGWLIITGSAHAATIVLIHGFQGQGMDWRTQGVAPALQSSGWQDAGHYNANRQGIRAWTTPQATASHTFFTVDLPASAPIGTQAALLDQYLLAIQQVRREPLMLVGHSAGGIVARYWLLNHYSVPVSALMTIATPHLGTPLADAADLLNDTPLAGIADIAGVSAFRQARHIARDLREDKPGTFLYWLNHQAHPDIAYISVIRNGERPDQADFVVPAHRQDMNNVYALRGRSLPIYSGKDHFLSTEDGYRIASVALTLPGAAP